MQILYAPRVMNRASDPNRTLRAAVIGVGDGASAAYAASSTDNPFGDAAVARKAR